MSVDNSDDEDNVVDFDEQAERIKSLKQDQDKQQKKQTKEPLFNLPFYVKMLMICMLVPYFGLEIIAHFEPETKDWVYRHFAFVPILWTSWQNADLYMPLSLITYNFLHGGILHIIMNSVMLLAFATGVEKFIGGKKMLMLFFLSSLGGIFLHFIIYTGSPTPVIGASAGLSGLFGALLVLMQQSGMMGMNVRIMPFVILWVIISVVTGVFMSVDGAEIAWIAHLGGFFAGLGLARLHYFKPLPY